MTESGRKAILYARVSTRGQAVKGYSLAQQIETLRKWAEDEGYEVLEAIEDPDQSGASLERPGIYRVRDLVRSGGVDLVVAQERDRFAREPVLYQLLKREFAEHGTKLRSLNDRGDDTPEGELFDGIFDEFAKFERAKTAERTRRGKQKKVRDGEVIRGSRAPYGFSYTEDGPGLVVKEPEMGVVRRIFEWIGLEGLTLGEVQRRLNGEGIPSPMANDPHKENSGLWHKPTIRKLVLSDLYRPLTAEEVASSTLVESELARVLDPEEVYGLWTHGTRHQKMWRERGEDGKPRDRYETVPKPREQWQAAPIPLSDAGLSRAHVDGSRERISTNTRRPASTSANRFWELSGGIVRCAECGNALGPKWRRRPNGKLDWWYACRKRRSNGSTWDCPHTRMYRAGELENEVWEGVYKLLSEPEHVLRQYDEHVEHQRRQKREDPGKEVRDLNEKLQKLDRRRSGYIDLAADNDISREELRAKLAEVDGQRRVLQKDLREATNRQETIQKLEHNREILETTLEWYFTMRSVGLLYLDPENRRRVFQALSLRVEVDRDGDIRISGVFDVDITKLLVIPPLVDPFCGHSTMHFGHEISPPFQGKIPLDNLRRPSPIELELMKLAGIPYTRPAWGGCERTPARS